MKGSCTLWGPGSGGDNCIHLKMSKTWGASVHLLLFLITDTNFFLGVLEQWEAVKSEAWKR